LVPQSPPFSSFKFQAGERADFLVPRQRRRRLDHSHILPFFGRAGRAFGIDIYLAKRWPPSML